MSGFFRTICSAEYYAGFVGALGVIAASTCYGWFSPTINYLLSSTNPDRMTESQLSWVVAIISLGEIISSIPAGRISDKVGRRFCLLFTGPMLFFTWIVIHFNKSFTVFMFIRIIQGIGLGTIISVVPVYLGEISSPANRGRITGFFSIGWFIGYLVEYCLGAVLSLPVFTFVTAAIPLMFTILLYFQPESPYYLVIKGNETKAKVILKLLRKNALQENIENEFEDIRQSVKQDLESKYSWKDIVRTSADRRAFYIVILTRLTRIQSGQVPLMTYSSNLFLTTGFTFLSPNVQSIILGIIMVLGGLASSSVIDSLGRRPLLMISCIGALGVVAAGTCDGWFSPTINYLLSPTNPERMTESEVSWLVAIISVGEFISSIPAGRISDKTGRRFCLLFTGPMLFFTWIVIYFNKSFIVFLFLRIIQGLYIGTIFSVVPVYLGETSSPANRGRITGFFSIGWFIGFLVEYCLGAVLSTHVFTLVTAAIPLMFTILLYFQPESPYYLVMKGNETKAKVILKYLRKNALEENIESEFEDIRKSVKQDLESKYSWKDIVQTSADRRALFIVLLIRLTRIESGQSPLMTYSSNLFSATGFTFLSPYVQTIILGIILVLGGLASSSVVDSLGRRPLLMISCIGSFFSLILVAIYFFFKEKIKLDVSSYGWVVPLGVTMYLIFVVLGMNPISITYTSELFTSKTRGTAASISTAIGTTGFFVSIKLYQIISSYFGSCIVFVYFSFVCLLGGFLLYFYAPETNGKTFTEIRSEIMNVKRK